MITVNLTIPQISTLVLQDGNFLMAQQNDATYQWLQCDDNYKSILNATDANFIPEHSGTYAVQITLDNCRDTSGCYEMNIASVISNTLGSGLRLFPNPTAGFVKIILPEAYNNTDVELTDQNGKVILKERYSKTKEISLYIDEPAGLYFLTVRNNRNDKSVIKITVED